jgi:hypothetical protein
MYNLDECKKTLGINDNFEIANDCHINDMFKDANESNFAKLEYCKENCNFRCIKDKEYKKRGFKTLQELQNELLEKYNDYYGIDVDLETSFFEYGMICKYNENDNDYNIVFYFNNEISNEVLIDSDFQSNESLNDIFDEMGKEDQESFLSFIGQNEMQWKQNNFVIKMYDLYTYGSYIVPFQYNYDIIPYKNEN